MLHPCKVSPAGAILLALSLVTAPVVASAREAAASTPPQVDMSQSVPGNHSGPALSAGLPEIVKMLDAKVDSETIKAFIQNSTMSYHPSAEELIMLKEHGASSDVLKGLLEHRAVAPAYATSAYMPPGTTAPNAAQVAPTYANGEMPNYDYSNPDYSYAAYPYYYPYYSYYYPYSYYWPYFSVGWYWPWYSCGHFHGNSFCWNHWGHNGFVAHGNTGFHGNNGFVAHTGTFNGHTAGFAHTGGFAAHSGGGFAPHGGGGFAAHGSGGFAARGGGGFAGHMGGGGFGGGHGGGGGHR